jgi:predicted MPP superfamily phosphohydrolase
MRKTALIIFGLAVSFGCGGGQHATVATVTTTAAAPAAAPDFTVVLLPDTQCSVSTGNLETPGGCGAPGGEATQYINSQMDWAIAHKDSDNIKAVVGLGDIVNISALPAQWAKADAAYAKLDAAGMPYAPTIGNHDYDSWVDRTTKDYNKWFGPARLSKYSWYGGSFPSGSNENFYITFESGTAKYLVLALEFFPRSTTIDWAKTILQANGDRQVLVATHNFLDANNKPCSDKYLNGLVAHHMKDGLNCDAVWTELSAFPNIIGIVNGHWGVGVTGRTDLVGQAGNKVPAMLSDYQDQPFGGEGYMRILRFHPGLGTIDVTSYSAAVDKFKQDAGNQFTVHYGK